MLYSVDATVQVVDHGDHVCLVFLYLRKAFDSLIGSPFITPSPFWLRGWWHGTSMVCWLSKTAREGNHYSGSGWYSSGQSTWALAVHVHVNDVPSLVLHVADDTCFICSVLGILPVLLFNCYRRACVLLSWIMTSKMSFKKSSIKPSILPQTSETLLNTCLSSDGKGAPSIKTNNHFVSHQCLNQ